MCSSPQVCEIPLISFEKINERSRKISTIQKIPHAILLELPFLCFPSDNVNTKTDMDMKIVTKNGKRYTYMSRMKIDIDMKEYNINYDLKDKELGELRKVISSFIGNNQQDVIAAVKTPLEQAVSKRILELSNNIVKHFTFEELFPDREWITFLTFEILHLAQMLAQFVEIHFASRDWIKREHVIEKYYRNIWDQRCKQMYFISVK